MPYQASRPHPRSFLVYERKRCLNWFVARFTASSSDFPTKDSLSAVIPSLLADLISYARKRY